MKLFKKKEALMYERPRDASVSQVFKESDINTKISYLVFGFGNIVNKQVVRGLIFLALEIFYLIYLFSFGIHSLGDFITLGTVEQGQVYNEALGIYEYSQGDDSMLCLLYGVLYTEAQGKGNACSDFFRRYSFLERRESTFPSDGSSDRGNHLFYDCTVDIHDFDRVYEL